MIRMVKKVLFCATLDIHFQKFHLPYLKWFKEQGWEVHVAAFGNRTLPYTDRKHQLPIQRDPFSMGNIQAYKVLKKLTEENRYDIIHCHTPMGGLIARLAARAYRGKGTKVIYTAHGFHFCKGAPLVNWLLYYPAEKILSFYTDCLVTINYEDYSLVKRKGWCNGRIEHVHGVGIDTERFKPVDDRTTAALRKMYGYEHTHFLMVYAAEFNSNKNQRFLIEALTLIKEQVPDAKLLLAGDGPMLNSCKMLAAQNGVEEMIDFLGYRDNIEPYLQMADLAVASSLREGLPVNIMEAMASGLPVLATYNRGHKELIQDGKNGFVIPVTDMSLFSKRLHQLYLSKELRKKMQKESLKRIRHYALENVMPELNEIYTRMITSTVQAERALF